MALQLFDRVRRVVRRRPARSKRNRARADAGAPPAAPVGTVGPASPAGQPKPAGPVSHAPGSHRRPPAPRGAAEPNRPVARPGPRTPPAPGSRGAEAAARTAPRRWGAARVAIRPAPPATEARAVPVAQQRRAAREAAPPRPWYEVAQSNRTAAGRRHCGHLEEILRRDWAADTVPPAEVVRAIDRLAELPQIIKDKLVAGLDGIYVGEGGVPDLDDMSRLSGVPLPSGRATWDACAGAYGERKIIVGSRPSPSPDVMCHEIGHALDDIDGAAEQWQSDSADFHALYDQCSPHLVSDFHRQSGVLGRREFFADAFAAIASRQRPALVDMLGGDTRAALNVMLYFNVRYGI
jgi:hypothetical protein